MAKTQKYSLAQNGKGEWEVKRFGKTERTFSDWNAYEAASDYIQGCVEDDNWCASNRD